MQTRIVLAASIDPEAWARSRGRGYKYTGSRVELEQVRREVNEWAARMVQYTLARDGLLVTPKENKP